MKLTIREAPIEELYKLNKQIPEFIDPYPLSEFQARLLGRRWIGLVAEVDKIAVGFKLGYALNTTVFYSWLGGVLPDFRKQGVAKALLCAQEKRAKKLDLKTIKVKSRNKHTNMLHLLIAHDYEIIKIKHYPVSSDNRLWFIKQL